MPTRSLVFGEQPGTHHGAAGLAKGFRPFFLVAGIHAALTVPTWIAVLLGAPWPHAPMTPFDWHAHEMVFGFAGAVIAGFLLTAVGNWTGRTTLEGGPLAALCALWLGGRIAPCVPGAVETIVPAAFDAAFWLGLSVACGRAIVASKNKRNYGFIVLLTGLLVAGSLSHAGRLGLFAAGPALGRQLGIDLLTLAMVVVTGRVVPMFTRNATGATGIVSSPALDRSAIVGTALLTVLDAARVSPNASAPLSVFVGILVLARARRWGAQHTLGKPLLWPLHLGHAWVGVGLVLRGVSAFVPALPASVALHAITAGGIGLLTLAMMTRVTLGHTGRMLAIPSGMAWAMRALSLAVLLRVLGPLIVPSSTLYVLAPAALLWSLAFASFTFVYAKPLMSPRADGRPG